MFIDIIVCVICMLYITYSEFYLLKQVQYKWYYKYLVIFELFIVGIGLLGLNDILFKWLLHG